MNEPTQEQIKEPLYTLNCSICGKPYLSREAFPKLQMCSTCAQPEDLLLTDEEVFEHDREWLFEWGEVPQEYKESLLKSQLVKLQPLLQEKDAEIERLKAALTEDGVKQSIGSIIKCKGICAHCVETEERPFKCEH